MYRYAPLFVILAAVLWGIDGIILRPSLYSLPVSLVVLIESGIVSVLLTPFFIKKIRLVKHLDFKDWISFIAVALFGGAIGTMAITKALFYTNINLSIVILIQKLQPLFALLLASILLKEQLTKKFFFWAVASIIGAYFMTFGFTLPNFSSGNQTAAAAIFALIAAVSFASSTVFSKRALKNVGFELGTYLRFVASTFIMIIIILPLNELSAIRSITSEQAVIFIIIAITSGGSAIFLYYYGLKNISASVATICELAFPLTAVILEYLIHGKILNIVQWIGVAILMTGIYKVTTLNLIKRSQSSS